MATAIASSNKCRIYKDANGTYYAEPIYFMEGEYSRSLEPCKMDDSGYRWVYDSSRLKNVVESYITGETKNVSYNKENYIVLDFTRSNVEWEEAPNAMVRTTGYIEEVGKKFSNGWDSTYKVKLYGETEYMTLQMGPYWFAQSGGNFVACHDYDYVGGSSSLPTLEKTNGTWYIYKTMLV